MKKYFKDIWESLYTVTVGMLITWQHLFAKKVTMQYPDKYHPIKSGDMPSNSRNRLFVDIEECNGCQGCARACPVNCITVDTVKTVPDDDVPPLRSGGKRGLWVTNFKIDHALCCFCSLCTEACPTQAIIMTPEFEYSTFDRNDLIYQFAVMSPEMIKEKTGMYEKFQAEKKKEKAQAAAAKAKAEKAAPKADDSAETKKED